MQYLFPEEKNLNGYLKVSSKYDLASGKMTIRKVPRRFNVLFPRVIVPSSDACKIIGLSKVFNNLAPGKMIIGRYQVS